MPTEIKRIPNEPIIVHKVIPPPKTPDDVDDIAKATTELKRDIKQHVYRIVDFTAFGENLCGPF